MKWFLLLLSLILLFAANNALFWIPGRYDWFNFTFAGGAIILAALFAWLSSRRFAVTAQGGKYAWKSIIVAPPSVIWLFVVGLFCLGGVFKFISFLLRR